MTDQRVGSRRIHGVIECNRSEEVGEERHLPLFMLTLRGEQNAFDDLLAFAALVVGEEPVITNRCAFRNSVLQSGYRESDNSTYAHLLATTEQAGRKLARPT